MHRGHRLRVPMSLRHHAGGRLSSLGLQPSNGEIGLFVRQLKSWSSFLILSDTAHDHAANLSKISVCSNILASIPAGPTSFMGMPAGVRSDVCIKLDSRAIRWQ